jgi:hypothetical protein
MDEVRIASTNDRDVVGVMNQFAFHCDWLWRRDGTILPDVGFDWAI